MRDEQFLNRPSSIDFIEEGTVISVNDEHSEKAYSPIDLTVEGILTLFNDIHS